MWLHIYGAKKKVALGLKVTTQLRPWHCASCCEDMRQRSMAVGRPCSRSRSRGRARNTRTRIRRWEGIWSATGCCLHLPEKETLESCKTCQLRRNSQSQVLFPVTSSQWEEFLDALAFSICKKISGLNLQKPRCISKNLGPASSLQRSSAPAPVMGVLAGVRPDKVLSWLPVTTPVTPWLGCWRQKPLVHVWSMFHRIGWWEIFNRKAQPIWW